MIKTTKKLKNAVAKTENPKPGPAKALSVSAAPAKPNRVLLELVKPDAKSVYVAGSFNDWKPEQTPLKPAGNGRWVGDLPVNPGRHEYLFVVDGQWVPDPNAKEVVQNPFGGTNSVLIVSE
jgi:1,4-alpha-glucan branching enzyme